MITKHFPTDAFVETIKYKDASVTIKYGGCNF